jgi:dTDP-glucose 4,6-dehydratase
MRMNTVLVTGGAGFVGSAMIREIIRETDYFVVNVDALTYAGNLESLEGVSDSPRHAFVHLNVADGVTLRRVFAQYQPMAVLHLAAESHVDRSIDGPGAFITTNVVGTYTLLEVSLEYSRSLTTTERDRFRFVHISTDEVYGSLGLGEEPFSERSPHAPNSPYAASKAAADHLVRAWYETYGLPVMTTNCSNNYGPFQFPEKLIPHMIISAIQGQPLPVYGDGGHIRDWLHVEDHVDALLAVLANGRPGEVYPIGARNEQRNSDVVGAICTALDELAPRRDGASYFDQITSVADRPGHDRRYAIDPSKTERELDWRAKHRWEPSLKETVRWYLGHESWWRRILDGTYRVERMGLAR